MGLYKVLAQIWKTKLHCRLVLEQIILAAQFFIAANRQTQDQCLGS